MPKLSAPHALTLPNGREYNKGDIIDVTDGTVLYLLATLTYEQRADVLELFEDTAPLPTKEHYNELALVYILGTGSRWNDNEIRYSLRSAEKYFRHGKVFVVGNCPGWLKNVTHIEAADPYDNKLKNSIHKLHTAVQDERLPQKFVVMNDDFFFLKQLDSLPVYHKGTLHDSMEKHPTSAGYYYEAIWLTKLLLEKAGVKKVYDYSVHFPMVFDKARVNWLCSSMRYQREGFLFRTVYANYFKLGGTMRKDVKIRNVQDITEAKNLDLFSTDDDIILAPEFQKWIKAEYPNPSKYETDTI